MQRYRNAIYKNGSLLLDRELENELEGHEFKVILIDRESDKTNKTRFFDFVKNQKFELPADYTFDREELHER